MEFCHDGNERANELGMQLIVKLSLQNGNHNRLYGTFVQRTCEMSVFTTSEDHMSFGLRLLKSRDIIHVMLGGPTPYALRPTKSDELLFVGEYFLYGSMHSEAIIQITIDIAIKMRKSSHSSFWSSKTTRVPSSPLAYFHLLQLLELQRSTKVLALGSSRRASPSMIP
jgi:hypothetical protein